MKKFGLLLMVLAIVGLCAASSNAALLSLYTFDGTTNNAVGGAPNGTLAGGATLTTGVVGSGALDVSGSGDYLDATPNLIPNGTSGGVMSGSISLWAYANGNQDGLVYRGRNTAGNDESLLLAFSPGIYGAYIVTRDQDGNKFAVTTDSTSATSSGTWQQLTVTWNATTGAAGTGTGAMYVNGNLVASSQAWGNGQTSDSVFPAAWTMGTIGSGNDGSGPNEEFNGKLDDVASWGQILSGTEAKALYNLATDTLNYNAADASALFDLYAAGSGTAVVGGQTWGYVASGLGTTGGAVIASSALNLGGASGAGVQIVPEPGTLSLLLAGAIGLLVFAWRKRK